MATLRETFSDIADAIRDKGVTGTMTPLEMPDRIAEIQTGKTVEICPENVGPYQYYMKFGAKGTSDALILNTTPYVDSTIETLDMSKIESIGTYGFYTAVTNSPALKTIITPSSTVEITGTYTFQRSFNGCSSLTGDIDMKFSGTAGNYAFARTFEGSGISSLNLDFSRCAINSSPTQLTYEICKGCENLVSVDINYPDFTNTTS